MSALPTMSLPRALALAMAQLGDRAILAVLFKTVAFTLALFAALGAGLVLVAGPWAARQWGGDSALYVLAGTLATLLAGWLLFRIVALAVLQFFADEVVTAVERRHYPEEAARIRPLGLGPEAANALRGAGRALLVNLAALPFALLLLATGIGTALLVWAVNGWLLGRELQDMVWLRHPASAEGGAPLSAPGRFALGGVVAGLMLVPFVNLLAPILGAAAATHLVHGRRR